MKADHGRDARLRADPAQYAEPTLPDGGAASRSWCTAGSGSRSTASSTPSRWSRAWSLRAGRRGRSSTAAAPAPPTPSPTSARHRRAAGEREDGRRDRPLRRRSPGHLGGGRAGVTHVVSQAGVPTCARRTTTGSVTAPSSCSSDTCRVRPTRASTWSAWCRWTYRCGRARHRRRRRADQPVPVPRRSRPRRRRDRRPGRGRRRPLHGRRPRLGRLGPSLEILAALAHWSREFRRSSRHLRRMSREFRRPARTPRFERRNSRFEWDGSGAQDRDLLPDLARHPEGELLDGADVSRTTASRDSRRTRRRSCRPG